MGDIVNHFSKLHNGILLHYMPIENMPSRSWREWTRKAMSVSDERMPFTLCIVRMVCCKSRTHAPRLRRAALAVMRDAVRRAAAVA